MIYLDSVYYLDPSGHYLESIWPLSRHDLDIHLTLSKPYLDNIFIFLDIIKTLSLVDRDIIQTVPIKTPPTQDLHTLSTHYKAFSTRFHTSARSFWIHWFCKLFSKRKLWAWLDGCVAFFGHAGSKSNTIIACGLQNLFCMSTSANLINMSIATCCFSRLHFGEI